MTEWHGTVVITTPRLLLRTFREDDLPAYAALNADPAVVEFLGGEPLTREYSDEIAAWANGVHDAEGIGLLAVERRDDGAFLGFVGLAAPSFEADFTPCVEVGWRLAVDAWGHGYATEAARVALAFGFDERGLDEILSWTVPANVRSRAVMERIGMTRDPADDFDHPNIAVGSPLRRHVLYRLSRERWLATREAGPKRER